MAVTRSQTYVHLIGEPVQLFNENMLPTTREVLQVYYHHHNNEKLSKTESITVTVREVCEIWARARVPSAEERNIIHKLKLLVDKHRTVCHNKTRGGTAQMARESNFEADMNGLFDIAHHDAMNRIKIEEDRVFLVDQRTERKYVMGKIDQQLTAVEGRRAVRIQREAELRTKEDRMLNDLAQASAPASASLNNGDTSNISDLDEESSAELSDYNPECKSSDNSDTQGQTQQKRAKISANEAVSPQLAAALDCTSVSNRDAAYILHAAATTYGQYASGMSLSVSSIRRTRSKRHIQAAGDVKSAFNRDGPLVIHFDGKLLPSIAGGPGKEYRVAIIVTGRTTEKLLAIPKVVQGTAEVKTRMASCLITASEHETSSERSIKYTGKEELGDKKLDYFIGSRSHFFFQVLNLDKLFLNLPVEQWPQLEAYLHAKVVAHSLKVVNDSAERGIALASNFNKSLTKKEDEKQYFYQVVESHRKQYPDAKNATLNQ
ncbi:hypothetical protein Bpfe_015034 [Biomphalaria pfeifferi]|uniref:Uncharacterized protein n=1 Tax=Biomphalaria pfeifferi TaxID=112525 RepID=A0AAD8BK70_BIOPF|nr:hypothetical protein Bpfe_015034 [Biomphalaria pfeifferi]